MIALSTRRTLVALATAATFLPAAPALAQTATPAPSASATPTPAATPTAAPTPALTDLTVSRPVIDFGQTVDVTVNGAAGTQVGLFVGNFRAPQGRQIRTATIGADGRSTWTGLRPEDTSLFFVRAADSQVSTAQVTVRVRRAVTIGIEQRTRGIYTFSGQLARAEAGVQVTIARLDDQTKRVTGVASTRTTADGRYVIATSLPQGLAGYYALTEVANGLDAGRSRLYGLLVNTTPSAAPAPVTQSVSLDVGRSSGDVHIFSGAVSPARSVPVTLARVIDGRLVGVAGGRSAANGGYVFRLPVGPGTHFFQVVTATATSRVYGLVVPVAPVVDRSATGAQPADVDCRDFSTQREAQAFHDRYFPQFGDFARLDGNDDDGRACEALP